MKVLITGLLSISLVVAAASGCATKTRTGAAVGGATGAVLGSAIGDDTEGAIIGGILGAIAGYGVGRYLEEQDREEVAFALEKSETGETSTWTNPDTGQNYAITPTETYTMSGNPCREFVLVREVNGEEYETTETACRRADGRWEIV